MSLLYFYWCDVTYRGSRRNLCDVILAFVYKQMVTSYYSVKLPPFPAKLRESPSLMGHALISSGDFPLHCNLRGFFRISCWFSSSSLYFTWYLLNAESIYDHFPNDVPFSLPKNWAPPFPLLHVQAVQQTSGSSPCCERSPVEWVHPTSFHSMYCFGVCPTLSRGLECPVKRDTYVPCTEINQ